MQWNSTLQPPRLYDHLIIVTIIFFQPKPKNHEVIYHFEDPVNVTTS